MTISSVSSTNSFLKQLEANGLSADKAKLVGNDLAAAETTSAVTMGTKDATVSSASVRAALDAKIDADVSSNKLSADDAAAVKKTLDDIDAQSSGSGITSRSPATADASAPATDDADGDAGGSGGSGGGGGGGSATKTERSETITVSGSTKTTTVTYTDNSTETTTKTASEADKARYGKPAASDVTTGDGAKSYLSTIEPGSLIDQTA